MKKVKQILAIIGVIILAGLYLATLIFAIIGSDDTMALFKAAVYATIVLPVLIWAYTMIYRLLKNHYQIDDLSKQTNMPAADDSKASEQEETKAEMSEQEVSEK